VIDKDKERQWDKEMSQVDKLLAKLPTYSSEKPALGGEPTLKRPAGSGGGPPARAPGGTAAGMWLKVALGVALAVGVTVWPYTHVCGLKLMFYFTAIGTVIVTGGWAALASWGRRSGPAHVLALGTLIWGLGLATLTVLPRLGDSATAAPWFCPEPPAQIAPTAR
jgi:hypothetical protein